MHALLDVNVLIALLDSDHVHHARARAWLKENIRHGWASCPLTQNGCIRIMSQPGYPNALPATAVADVWLRQRRQIITPFGPMRSACSMPGGSHGTPCSAPAR
jgi:predicted nucleic acid-binding protein